MRNGHAQHAWRIRLSGLSDRTHGRWPWVAAAAALPVTAAYAASRRRLAHDHAWAFWAPLPLYLWHQTEEWVWPGGFLPWFNREVLGSDEDEFPISRRMGLAINTVGGWGLAVASGGRGMRSPGLGAFVLGQIAGNAGLHVYLSARAGRYTPGFATSLVALGPVSATAIATIARDRRAGRARVLLAAAAGVASGSVLFSAMRRRVAG